MENPYSCDFHTSLAQSGLQGMEDTGHGTEEHGLAMGPGGDCTI